MSKRIYCLIAILLGMGTLSAFAQRPKTKENVAELRKSLRGLEWKTVDFDALSPLHRCRALTLLDHALTEIGAVATAEADLMSQYLEQQALGTEFSSSQPVETAPARTYEDGQKIAAALLQGPMAESSYSTMYEESDEIEVKASSRLHESVSRRKWARFSGPVQHVRSMVAFLKSKDGHQDYLVWARAEFDRRQLEHEQTMAERRAAASAKSEQIQKENAARAKELTKRRQQEKESRLAQQAIYAQAVANAQAMANAQRDLVEESEDDDYWYPIRYYRRPQNPHVEHWHRNDANQVRELERTNKRVNTWRGKGGRRP